MNTKGQPPITNETTWQVYVAAFRPFLGPIGMTPSAASAGAVEAEFWSG